MKEKELRLAIVFFGGVSLAIYQHGINREILNLIRASKHYHRKLQSGDPTPPRFHSLYPDEPEQSTIDVYYQFLESIGQTMALRVLVDVIAGASAGGINGIVLARALAHDLSIEPLTDMWLNEADMLKLLAPEAKARYWSKWYFWPFIRPMLKHLSREGLLLGKVDAEMQARVSVFLRSRWFKPPLDGKQLTTLVLDGLAAMEYGDRAPESLMPAGTRLDLIVTATDFRGLDRMITIHDPPMVFEHQHGQLLRFSLDHHRTGHVQSDFDADSIPSLAFAARASASYPGAFPPAQIREIDDLLAARHQPWPSRSRFVARNFTNYRDQNRNPEEAVLVDGSILDNKPIMATIDMIRSHSAYREVDRRLVYIDPHARRDPQAETAVPGFFATLRGALSDLPRTDPLYNELAEISRYNIQARRLKEAITMARKSVTELIDKSTEGKIKSNFSTGDLRHWRLTSTNLLEDSPIVYNAWMRSLVREAMDFIAQMVTCACAFAKDGYKAHLVDAVIEQWAITHSIIKDSYKMPERIYGNEDLPDFARMVVDFGVVYKKRRLNFVLNEINDLYATPTEEAACAADPQDLDLIKIKIHKLLDQMVIYEDSQFLSQQAITQCRDIFLTSELSHDPISFVANHDSDISALVRRLGIECDLARSNDDVDAVLSSPLILNLQLHCRNAILIGYLGYFYWDIILRPTVSALSLETGPIEEILIDRISPDDAAALMAPEARRVLLGGNFAGFGGFLSRATRENDYLWGRLHGVDRLFDILGSTVPPNLCPAINITALKKAAFERVLAQEAERLKQMPDLVAAIRERIAAFGAAPN